MKGKFKKLALVAAILIAMAPTIVPVAVAVEVNSSGEQIKDNQIGIDGIVKPKIVSYKDVKKGDIITTGERNNSKELCKVSFGMSIDFGPNEKGSKSVTTKVDDNCNVIVKEIKENTQSIESSGNAVITSLKSISQDYWMYGYGGEWDKLTEDLSQMTFYYDGSTSSYSSGSGSCIPHSSTGWSNTYCRAWPAPTSGDVTTYNVRGDFEWINNLYQHTLWTTISGTKSGSTSCNYVYSGSIVSGTKSECTL